MADEVDGLTDAAIEQITTGWAMHTEQERYEMASGVTPPAIPWIVGELVAHGVQRDAAVALAGQVLDALPLPRPLQPALPLEPQPLAGWAPDNHPPAEAEEFDQ